MDDPLELRRQQAIDAYRRAIETATTMEGIPVADFYRTELAPIPAFLSEAISNLYVAFSRYSSWSKTPNYGTPGPEAMYSKKMTELSADDLSEYSYSALYTWGDLDDFRHFLPRLLELCLDRNGVSAPIVLRKLRYANWQNWPNIEQDALTSFLEAWWNATLCSYPCSWSIHDVLEALASVYLDLQPYFSEWSNLTNREAYRHFIDSNSLLETRSSWMSEDQSAQATKWLFSNQTLQWLEDGYCRFMAEYWTNELSQEVDRIGLHSAYRKALK